MRRYQSTFVALMIALMTIACSTNPATGKREFNIVSEGQEVAMGQQSHPEILKQFGVYDEKPELNRLVDQVGRRLAAQSERPNLPWTFTILDTPMINAMALPGGYIYITRGMLERINSEDELAGVLGHEIAHVTARHAAQQISRSQLAQLGMVAAAVVAGPQVLQQYGQFAEIGLALLFQKYSRGQETQADLLGTGYMAEARYHPVGAARMLMTLQRLDRGNVSGLDRYFMSHPDPAKRVKDVQAKIAELGGMTSAGGFESPNREAFVRLLDGSITANSTKHMVIKDNVIYDRGHNLVVRTPNGWTATTQPGVLFAMQPRGQENPTSYLVAQEVDLNQLRGRTVDDAVRASLQQMGLQFAGTRYATARTGERFNVDVWQGQTQSGVVGVESTQFRHGDHVAVFLFVSPSVNSRTSGLGEVLSNMDVSVARARSVEPPRMHIGTVRSGESWSDLARRSTGNSNDAKELAHLNGFDEGTPPPAGMMVKLPEDVIERKISGMPKTSPEIDRYIANAPEFAQPILSKIRKAFHKACPDIEETMKWSAPFFDYKGIVGSMAAFKQHVGWGFWKSRLMSDPHGILEGEGTAMGGMRVESIKDLPSEKIMIEYIKEAVSLNEKGVKVDRERRSLPPLDMPGDLAAALKKNTKAKKVFDAFPPSQRRDYIAWITESKQEATRTKRLAQAIEWMAEGKSRNWKYEKKK